MDMIVSVCMITYNHEPFIAQAIEGVLMQQTNFPYELVISDDCSTDGTRSIISDYARQYPEKIRLLLPERNQGMVPNFVSTLNACKGRYVALCEGDDYWTDPLKLQKQVEFMEAHPEYSFCFHNVHLLKQETGDLILEERTSDRANYGIDDILAWQVSIHTASVLFRREPGLLLPNWFYDAPCSDTVLFALLALRGKVQYLKEIMSVYRIHKGGVWQGADWVIRYRMAEETLLLLQQHLGPKYNNMIKGTLSINFLNQAVFSKELGDIRTARKYIIQSLRTCFNPRGRWMDQTALLISLYFPKLYLAAKGVLKTRQKSNSIKSI